jgi:hypothetical protein
MGGGSGGAAAFTMSWFRPEGLGASSPTGAFVDQKDDDAAEEARHPGGACDYHSDLRLIEASPVKPLRVLHHVSENDPRFRGAEEAKHNWVLAGRRTAVALEARQYPHRLVYSLGSRRCDSAVVGATLADTLIWTWQGLRP